MILLLLQMFFLYVFRIEFSKKFFLSNNFNLQKISTTIFAILFILVFSKNKFVYNYYI